MKKVIISAIIITSFIIYAILNGKSKEQTSTQNQPIPTSSTMTSGKYMDGEYTGEVADAYYGNIQVKAVISGGKITDVIFLQYPNDQHESLEINGNAMPILKQEAIQAQSANVDIVSRATDSSNAFIQSMGSALKQAQM